MSFRKYPKDYIGIFCIIGATLVTISIAVCITLGVIMTPHTPEQDNKPYVIKDRGVQVVCTWSRPFENSKHEEWVCQK